MPNGFWVRYRGAYEIACLLDTGPAVNVMPQKILDELEEKQVFVSYTRITAPLTVCYGSAKHQELVARKCRLGLTIAAQTQVYTRVYTVGQRTRRTCEW